MQPSEWQNAIAWQREHGFDIFPTKPSLKWFIRKYYDELIERDVYIPRRGRAGALVRKEVFGDVAVEITKREALMR